jgi:hypothetical protein
VIVAIASELLKRPPTAVKAVPKVVGARGTRCRTRPEAGAGPEPEPPRDDPFGLYGPRPRRWWRDRRVRLGWSPASSRCHRGRGHHLSTCWRSSVGGGGRTTLFSGGSDADDEEDGTPDARRDAEATPAPADPGRSRPRPDADAPAAGGADHHTASAATATPSPATPEPSPSLTRA